MNKNTWQMPPLNMAGVALFDEYDIIPTGYYAFVVLDSEDHVSKDSPQGSPPSSVMFRLKITDQGPEQGKVATAWIGKDPKEGNVRRWKALYVSVGYPIAQLEQMVQPHATHLINRQGYMHYVSPPVGEGQKLKADQIQINFVTQEQYVTRKREEAQAPRGFSPTAAAPSMPAAPPSAFGAPAPSAFGPTPTNGSANGGAPQQGYAPQPQYAAPPPQQQPQQQYAAPPPPAVPPAPAAPLVAPVPPMAAAAPASLYQAPPPSVAAAPPAPGGAPDGSVPPPPGGANVIPIHQAPVPSAPAPQAGSALFGPGPTPPTA